jgi:ankyrin repeat protein
MVGMESDEGVPSLAPITFKGVTAHYQYTDPKLQHGALEVLLKGGADPNVISASASGREVTPLMVACECCCSLASARMLLAHNCNPWQQTNTGSTALHTAARKGLVDVCKLLLETDRSKAGVRDSQNCTPLDEACRMGHLAVVELLHAQYGCDLLLPDADGGTLLHAAAGRAKPPLLQYLIRNGLDVNAVEPLTGSTAVCVAAEAGNAAAVQTLLEHGASTAAVNRRGQSLLFASLRRGAAGVVDTLLRHSKQPAVDVNARDAQTGKSALVVALANGVTDTLAVLLKHGADVTATDAAGTAPLILAAICASAQCVQLLLNAGADITAELTVGVNVLHTAVNNSEHPEVLQLLLEHSGAAAMIDSLAALCDCCGKRSPLMTCAQPAHLKLLLAAGADVHKTTDSGNTALHVAAVHKFAAPVLCLLIKAGVDLHAENSAGKTAAQVAADTGNRLAAALLTRAARDS